MELTQGIITRRSVRKYSDRHIRLNDIQTIVEAGMCAPSARNRRPWGIITITDVAVLGKLSGVRSDVWRPLKQAQLGIVCCACPGDSADEADAEYMLQDCSAATQNMLLCAHGLGLGAVWLGVNSKKEYFAELCRMLQLPDGVRPVSLMAVGYPDEQPALRDRFERDKWHREHW